MKEIINNKYRENVRNIFLGYALRVPAMKLNTGTELKGGDQGQLTLKIFVWYFNANFI